MTIIIVILALAVISMWPERPTRPESTIIAILIAMIGMMSADAAPNIADVECKFQLRTTQIRMAAESESQFQVNQQTLSAYNDCLIKKKNLIDSVNRYNHNFTACKNSVTNLSKNVEDLNSDLNKIDALHLMQIQNLTNSINEANSKFDIAVDIIIDLQNNQTILLDKISDLKMKVKRLKKDGERLKRELVSEKEEKKKLTENIEACMEREKVCEKEKKRWIRRSSECKRSRRKFRKELKRIRSCLKR